MSIPQQIGAYRIVRQLGAGGMAQVYLVEHTLLPRRYALKLMDPRFTANEAVTQRFINEGIAIAKLAHPNIVGVHDVGRVSETGAVFIVLEYLEGESLAHHFARRGSPTTGPEIVKLLGGPASALMKAHQLGAIHRDIKPDNLFLSNGKVIVLDFGVAQLNDTIAKSPGTQVGTLIGTPVYMSPEQLSGQRVTYASDLYALALCAYEGATHGFSPYQLPHETRAQFVEVHEGELLYRHRTTAPIDVRARNPHVPDALADAIMTGLSQDPRARGESIGAFVVGMASACGSEGWEALREAASDLLPRTEAMTLRRNAPVAVLSHASSKTESRYRILDELGSGGMAEVFTAQQHGDSGFTRLVALKRILPAYAANPDFFAMFSSEAQLVSNLRHPNVINVSDFARDAEGRFCIVMDFVHGKDLDKLMASGPIPPSLAIWLISEVLRGLDYAHNASAGNGAVGMLHRDIKPHNVLLGYEGNVIVADFGLAKVMSHSGRALSQTVKGTPQYMAPEQVRGLELDRTTDLWAVGVMLWEILTGRSLFAGLPAEVMSHVLFAEIPRPSTVAMTASGVMRPVPPDVEAITMRMLSRDRAQRFQTAAEVIDALVACADAPRDGRGELIRLLAERFVESPARLRSSPSAGGGSASAPRSHAKPATVSLFPSSGSGGVAAQSMPRDASSEHRRIRPLAMALLGIGVIGLATGATVLVVRASKGASRSEPPSSTIADATHTVETAQPDAAIVAVVGSTGVDGNVLPTVDAGAIAPIDAPIDAPDVASSALVDAAVVVRTIDAGTGSAKTTEPEPVRKRPDPTPAAKGTGELAVFVPTSYAEVWIGSEKLCQTPCRKKLPAGKHRIRLVNSDIPKTETLWITIVPDETKTIERSW